MYAELCNDERLQLLLAEDEASDAFRAAAQHVESCQACQSRLTTLAADETWWTEVRESLSGDRPTRWQPDMLRTGAMPQDRSTRGRTAEEMVSGMLAPPTHPELLGRLGRYDVEGVIGSGGMGIVLKAYDSKLNRPVAIKVLAAHLAHVGASRERFAREGRAAAAVVHEHVVAIHNVETDDREPFLVMQYVPGQSLQARVDKDGPLAVEQILRIGMQAAAGLAAAHAQGLVHRDVKPSNILLEETVERAVLTDFGLARTMDDASLTHTGVLAGTPHYMSPEQATGDAIDHRSDLFSLGAVLYFMATGRPPFRAEGALAVLNRICRDRHRPVWQVNRDVPDELSELIDRLLEKKPSRRPASVANVADELATILSRVQRFGSRRRRFGAFRSRRLRRRALVIAAVVVAVAAAVASWPPRGTKPRPVAKPGTSPTTAELADAMSADAEKNMQFARELTAVRDAVDRAERSSYFTSPGKDSWQKELDALRQKLSELETESTNFVQP